MGLLQAQAFYMSTCVLFKASGGIVFDVWVFVCGGAKQIGAQVCEFLCDLATVLGLASPLNAEQESTASEALARLSTKQKYSKFLVSPGVLPALNNARELLKSSAADRRSATAFDEAEKETDTLLESMVVQRARGCCMASVQSHARSLRSIFMKLKGLQANSSPSFQQTAGAKLNELQGRLDTKLSELRVAQSDQFWSGMEAALSLFTRSMQGKTAGPEDSIIEAALSSPSLVSALAAAASTGMAAIMSQECLAKHDSVIAAMNTLKTTVADFQDMLKNEMWDCFAPEAKALCGAFDALHSLSESDAAEVWGGSEHVWPTVASNANGEVMKVLVDRAQVFVQDTVSTTFGKLHTNLKALLATRKKDKSHLLLAMCAPVASDELCNEVQVARVSGPAKKQCQTARLHL